MPPPLLNLALVALILSACSSSFSGFIAALATFALVYLIPPRTRKRVSFSDKRNKVHSIDTSDSAFDDDKLPPTSPIKDDLAHLHPLCSNDDLLGRLTSIEEEDDEGQVNLKPYAISVEDYVPIAAMSLPPMRSSSSTVEDNVIEKVREDQQNLTENLGVSQSAPAVPAPEMPIPLAAALAAVATATVSAAAQGANTTAQEVVAAAASHASKPEETSPRQAETIEQTSNEGCFSLADLSAEIHRDMVAEKIRARRSFVQPSDLLYNKAYRAQLRQEAERALAAGSRLQVTEDASEPVPCIPKLLVTPPTEAGSSARPYTPTSAATTSTLCGSSEADPVDDEDQSLDELRPLQQDDAELSTSNVDLFHLPISRVERYLDRRLSTDSYVSLPTTSRVMPVYHLRDRVASDPLPERPIREADVPLSPAELLADLREPYDGGVGLQTPLSPQRVGQRLLPMHRPWANASSPALIPTLGLSQTALEPEADTVVVDQRPVPLVHRRSFSDSHFNYFRARHPDYVARLNSPPLPLCSTPPEGGRDKSRSASPSRGTPFDSPNGSASDFELGPARSESALESASAQSWFSATFLSTPPHELESQINSALSDESFEESLRLAGYSWGIGTIPFLNRRSGTSEPVPVPALEDDDADGNSNNSGVANGSATGSQAFSDSPPLSPSASASANPSARSAFFASHSGSGSGPSSGSRSGSSEGGSGSGSGSGSSTSTRRPSRSVFFREEVDFPTPPQESTSGRLRERQRTLTPGSLHPRDHSGSASASVPAEPEEQTEQDAAEPPSSSFSTHLDKQKQKEGLALFSLSLPREGDDSLISTALPPPPAAGRAPKAVVVSLPGSGRGSRSGAGRGKEASQG